MKRKIAAIMCADVVGYSRLVAEDEEEALRRLMAYRKVFQTFIDDAGGRIFNTAGDAILAEFPSAVDGVRAAIDIQESLRTRNTAYPKSRQMPFRIGITIGDVVEQDGDLLGDAVNIAARLQTLAQPGSICLSHAVREQVANKLSARFRDLGPQSVKNIPQEIHAFTVELGQVDEPAVPAAAPTGNRPSGPQVRRANASMPVLVAGVALVSLAVGAGLYWFIGAREVETAPQTAAVMPAAPAPPAVVEQPAVVAPSLAAPPQPAPAQAAVVAAETPPAAAQAPTAAPPVAPPVTPPAAIQPATSQVAAPPPPAADPAPSPQVAIPPRADAPAADPPAGGSPEDAGGDPADQVAMLPGADAADDVPAAGGAATVLPPPRPQPTYSNVPLAGRAFSPGLVPFVCDSCRDRMASQYTKGGRHKAVAINTLGDVGWAWEWNTEEGARASAIEQCKGRNGKDCEVFAVDSTIVWEHPAPVVPNRPWVDPADPGAQFDAAAIAGLSDSARQTLTEKYASALGPKALAVGPGGEWSYFTKGDSVDDVMRQALEVCSHFAEDVCVIAAVNDRLVNGGGAEVARTEP